MSRLIAAEPLVSTAGARTLLSGTGVRVGHTYMAALKRAAGIRSSRFHFSRLSRYLEAHPDFRVADVYPLATPSLRGRRPSRTTSTVDTVGEP